MLNLKKGDHIGIIAPSNYFERKEIDLGISYLKSLGFEVVLGKHILKKYRWMAGTEIERAEDINNFYKDKSIKALFCACGGSGSQKILEYIDYDSISKNPKPIFGFSDNTAIQLGVYAKTGQISYTGFDLKYDFRKGQISETVAKSFEDTVSAKKQTISSGETVVGGKTEGVLIGGCLSLIKNLIGTEFFPNIENSILLIEDVEEKTYKLDLMLDQLRKTKGFSKVKGIIFGEFADCITDKPQEGSVDDVISYFVENLNIPIIKNFKYGHIADRYILPIGANIELDADNCIINL